MKRNPEGADDWSCGSLLSFGKPWSRPWYKLGTGTNNSSSLVDWYEWPEVTYADIYNFLINTTSYCTHEQLKAYKSLDGYNFFVNGWVTNIDVISSQAIRPNVFILMSLVKHSQRLAAPPLKVWVATKQQGEVLCAHCSCMAGLGEACSHIAALLFAAETNTQLKGQFASTSLPCNWLPPSFRSVPFAEIACINFSTPAQKRKQLLKNDRTDTPASSEELPQAKKKGFVALKPTEDERDAFFKELSQCKEKPVILSLIPGYNEPYIPLYEAGKVMKPLTELYSAAALKLSYPDLLQKCEEIYEVVSFSFNQAQQVEEMTRLQADSQLWFQQRAGRITASKLRQVLHTDYSQPSVSLVSSICYPETHKARSAACQCGCKHENIAREKYIKAYSKTHETFFVIKSGLVLLPSYPFFGATPDGIVNCSCCGAGVLEIKCPFRCKEISFEDATVQGSFCLEKDNSGLRLKIDHAYYYQVQLQMKICQVEYADFVLWREEEMFFHRIVMDREFIDDAINHAESFIKLAILPELVGKWFTKQNVTLNEHQTPQQLDHDKENSWCYCKKGEDYGAMIDCDNDQCPIQWFHFSSLKMTPSQAPKGKWYCPECHKSKKGKGKTLVQLHK